MTMLSFQVILLAGAVSCSSAWFVGPRSTVTQLQWLGAHPASAVHQPLASCAVVESSLPPCRNVRQLRIAPSPATRMAKTADPGLHLYRELEGDPIQKVFLEGANDLADEDVPSAGERTARFGWWWEPVTVTRVATAPALARTDPSQVVTFSVRGCRPTVMPFNLPPCPTKSLPEEQPPQTSTVPGSEKPVGDDDPGITDSQNDV